jgi:hypothetical protein
MHAVLTEDGKVMPCDLLTWAHFLESSPQRRIWQEELPGGYWLSTVFLGLDHGSFGRQLWFETMLFKPPRELAESIYLERYETLAEAMEGHAQAKRWFERQHIDADGNLVPEPGSDDSQRRF